MSQTLHDFVLETLCDARIRDVNFQFGALRVYPSGYSSEIASCIRNGTIELTSDAARVGITNPAGYDGAFAIDTPPGRTHGFFVSSAWTEYALGRLCVRSNLDSRESAHLRGLVVHESTHALQDWQHCGATPRAAEGAAHLAGCIASRTWGYTPVWPIVDPLASGMAYAQTLAERFLRQSPGERYVIPPEDVARLEERVPIGSRGRYVFNGI